MLIINLSTGMEAHLNFIHTIARQAERYPHRQAITLSHQAPLDFAVLSYADLIYNLFRYRDHYFPQNRQENTRTWMLLPENCLELLVFLLAGLTVGARIVLLPPSLSTQQVKSLRSILGQYRTIGSSKGKQFFAEYIGADPARYSIYPDLLSAPEYSPQYCRKLLDSNQSRNAELVACSSGSSGEPKLVSYRFQRLNRFLAAQSYIFRQFPDQRETDVFKSPLVAALPIYYLGGLVFILQGLLMCRTVHLIQQFVAALFGKLLAKSRPAMIFLLPSMYMTLLQQTAFCLPSSVRFCIYGGEPCSNEWREKIENRFNRTLLAAYGLSECLTGIAHHADNCQQFEKSVNSPADSCGRQLFGEILLLANGESIRDRLKRKESAVAAMQVGILWVKNPTVAWPYLDREQSPDSYYRGWFCTGDIFRKDPQGYFFYLGRADHQVQINGRNFFLQDIEHVYLDHEAIDEVVAAPITNCKGKLVIALLCKLHEKSSRKFHALDLHDTLMQFWLDSRDSGGMPVWFRETQLIPQLSTGKIDRVSCTRLLQGSYDEWHASK